MRVVQPEGTKGSLRWMQRAVEEQWPSLNGPIAGRLGGDGETIDWRSPRRDDDFAEYRDSAFLKLLGLERLNSALQAFWPKRGPQWDALGMSSSGKPILVEAKAHIREFCTPATAASLASRAIVDASFLRAAVALGSRCGDRWPNHFYQFGNRLAHLWFLREMGVDAYLAFVGFLDDAEMSGPTSAETWDAVYCVAAHVLGLPAQHALAPFIIHVHPSVSGNA